VGIVDDLLPLTDGILGLRDDLGVAKKPVYILTRTWSGAKRGEGLPTDAQVQVLPSPRIVDLSHSLRVREGGAIRQGDLILKMISKQSNVRADIDGTVTGDNLERWYHIEGSLYEVISVTERHVDFNVQVRKTSKQKFYL